MSHPFARITLVAVFSALLAATAFGQGHPAQTRANPSRTFAQGTWQVVRQIGLDDDLLDRPDLLAVDTARAVLFDYGTHTVKSISLSGTLEWNSGRKGQGPGEYINPTSLRLDAAGRTIIYDPEQGRITTIDRAGKLVASVPLPERFELALTGRSSSQFVLLTTRSETFITLADTVPNLRAAAALPADFRQSGPITRELAGSLSSAQGHLLAFRWSSRMMLIDGDGRLTRSCMGVDSLSLPAMSRTKVTIDGNVVEVQRVDKTAEPAVRSITALGGWTVTLRPTVESDGGMILDLYHSNCGGYLESRRLPFAAAMIAGTADVLVATVMEPVPHLVLLRWRGP